MKNAEFSRRAALGLAGAGLSAALATRMLGPIPAQAKAPFTKTAHCGFYNFMHGDMQVSVISDGFLPFGPGRILFVALLIVTFGSAVTAWRRLVHVVRGLEAR